MTSSGVPFARVVLLGLEDSLARELEAVLGKQEIYVEPFHSGADSVKAAERVGADLVFCAADPVFYLDLLDAVQQQKPELPVVVVSRTPEVSEWLDAIEAGATDYCAAPFERAHIEWILSSSLKKYPASARYRAAG